MKTVILILLAFLCSIAEAQIPRIDSVVISESKREIRFFGQFGIAKGRVFIDSLKLPAQQWSTTQITCPLADTGKGSSGNIVIETPVGSSRPIAITQWHVITGIHSSPGNNGATYEKIVQWNIYLRGILDSSNERQQSYPLQLQKISTGTWSFSNSYTDGKPFYKSVRENASGTLILSPKADSLLPKTFTAQAALNLTTGTIDLSFSSFCEGIYHLEEHYLSFENGQHWVVNNRTDSSYSFNDYTNIRLSYDPYLNLSLGSNLAEIYLAYSAVFNPVLISPQFLRLAPALITPSPNAIFANKYDLLFQWNSLPLMTDYHLQISTDANFKRIILDSISQATMLSIDSLSTDTTFYWRVAGINTEGQSQWSAIRKFKVLPTVNSVATELVTSSLSISPNPASAIVTIRAQEPIDQLSLYTAEGKEILKHTISSESITSNIDISSLPAGRYMVRVNGKTYHSIQPIMVVH